MIKVRVYKEFRVNFPVVATKHCALIQILGFLNVKNVGVNKC